MRLSAALLAISLLGAPPLPAALAGPQDPYVPGLGEFMGAIQTHHAKLWFAGKAKNWELAAYELDELKEGFENAAKYQPEFKGKPIAELIGSETDEAVASLRKAIEAKDIAKFTKAMDGLSSACTSCHRAAGFGFIVIQRPAAPPLTNQRFDLRHNP